MNEYSDNYADIISAIFLDYEVVKKANEFQSTIKSSLYGMNQLLKQCKSPIIVKYFKETHEEMEKIIKDNNL